MENACIDMGIHNGSVLRSRQAFGEIHLSPSSTVPWGHWQPSTHWRVQVGLGLSQVGGQAEPHSMYTWPSTGHSGSVGLELPVYTVHKRQWHHNCGYSWWQKLFLVYSLYHCTSNKYCLTTFLSWDASVSIQHQSSSTLAFRYTLEGADRAGGLTGWRAGSATLHEHLTFYWTLGLYKENSCKGHCM